MAIEHDDSGTFWTDRQLGSAVLRLEATKARPEKTGLHAKITIYLDEAPLAWSTFNIERDEERVRLGNSAYKLVERDTAITKLYPKEYLKTDLDKFCHRLEDALVQSVDIEDLEGALDPTPPPFVVRPYVLSGGGTILYGPPGRGKSYTLLLMAVSLSAGVRSVFDIVEKRNVLVINLERSRASQQLRLGSVNAVLGLPRTRSLRFINARGRSLADVSERIRKEVRDQKIDVIFLDSLSRAGVGDLTENAPVNKITDLLNGLCPTWFALAHSPRGDDTHVYGSVHFDAAADVMVQLVSQVAREKFELGVGLEITKANDFLAPDMQVVAMRFSAEGLGLEGVRESNKKEFLDLAPSTKGRSTDELMVDYLRTHGEGAAPDVASAIGRSRQNVAELFAQDKRFEISRRESKKLLYRLSALGRNGTVVHDSSHDRNDRNGDLLSSQVSSQLSYGPRDVNGRARAHVKSGRDDSYSSGDEDERGQQWRGQSQVSSPNALRAGTTLAHPVGGGADDLEGDDEVIFE